MALCNRESSSMLRSMPSKSELSTVGPHLSEQYFDFLNHCCGTGDLMWNWLEVGLGELLRLEVAPVIACLVPSGSELFRTSTQFSGALPDIHVSSPPPSFFGSAPGTRVAVL